MLTIEQAKAKIQKQIDDSLATIKESGHTVESAKKFAAENEVTLEMLLSTCGENPTATPEQAAAYELSSKLSNAVCGYEMARESIKSELMACHSRYVMYPKGEHLTSPAGLHPTDRVFIQTSKAVHTDRLPRASNLVYSDLSEIK